ncbi:MAG: sugar transferase, partial [Anaerolineae bacterium]|nr:sugar transferase [Anaerolineae bacterium]
IKDLPVLVTEYQADELVLASDLSYEPEVAQLVVDQYIHGIHFVNLSNLFERLAGRIPVEHIGKDWFSVLPNDDNSQYMRLYYTSLKRLFDVIFAIVGFILTLPVMAITTIIIKLDSRGPVIYTQERVGLYGKTFRIYKFRTMVTDAEAKTGAVFAQKNDSRVTRIGRFLRKSRIDELPQFINILRGDMSFIGPRPERPVHVERLAQKIPFYNTRLVVRPGLSGWAQICYDYGSDDEDARKKLEYDLYYIRYASLALDLTIVFRTFYKVITLSGQ